MKIFINTMTLGEKYNKPFNQVEMIKELIANGYKNIEVRRDFITRIAQEIFEISELARENKVTIYYSVQDTLYKNFTLNKNAINQYIDEARILGAESIKFSIGTYAGYNKGDNEYIKDVLNTGIKIYVENDKSFENGRIDKLTRFLKDSKTYGNNIRASFDIGNWLWAGEEPESCSEILKEYVDYVHLKDVKIVDGKYCITKLGDGIVNWRYFNDLFKGNDIGLNYPCGINPIETIKEEIKKIS